jgi:uncharacterized pyridoxamine 5'-phosphate oxidase family protein
LCYTKWAQFFFISSLILHASHLNDAKTFYLATTKDGKPDVRPMGISLHYEDKIYFITAKGMNLHSEFQNDSNVSITACVEDKWVRIDAVAVLDDSEKIKTTFPNLNEKILKPSR